jgi:hypothetical protein
LEALLAKGGDVRACNKLESIKLANSNAHSLRRRDINLKNSNDSAYDHQASKHSPQAAKHSLYLRSETFQFDLSDSNSTPELDPITPDEVKFCVNEYIDTMNPNSNVYGCAACGVWCILSQKADVHKRPLKDLSILILSEEQLASYNLIPTKWKKMKGVTQCSNGNFYALYTPYVLCASPNCESEDCTIVSENDVAYLCIDCHKSTNPNSNNRKIPDLSIRSGVDYGLAWLHLPKLSMLEKLILSKYQLYAHVLKIGAGSGVCGMKGHMIAMESNARDIMKEICESIVDNVSTDVLIVPPNSLTFSFMYCGPMDKWDRINSSHDERLKFIQLFKRHIHIKFSNLVTWIEFLSYAFPNFNIQLNKSIKNQEDCNELIFKLMRETSVHGENSLMNKIDMQSRTNVPGADATENTVGEDGAVDFAAVLIAVTNDIALEAGERKSFLTSVHDDLFSDGVTSSRKRLHPNPEDIFEETNTNKNVIDEPLDQNVEDAKIDEVDNPSVR